MLTSLAMVSIHITPITNAQSENKPGAKSILSAWRCDK
jgi:hypothetical protein